MIVRVDREKKLAEVWMSNADQRDPAQKKRAEELYRRCRDKKLFVVTYESGQADVAENTAALLHCNYC